MTTLSKDKKNILSLYAMIGAGSILMVIPYGIMPVAGFVSVLVAWVATFFYRMKNKQDAIYQFHMKFLNRTVLVASLILMIGIGMFGCIIFFNGDTSSIMAIVSEAERGMLPTERDVAQMQYDFVMANRTLIVITAMVTLLPYPLYLIYRMIKGVRLLTKS